MPSGNTHILLMKHLQEELPEGPLKRRLAEGRDFLQLGAVAPDLPYASIADREDLFFSTQTELADLFHYERTTALPLEAFRRLGERKATLSDETLTFAFAFFAGYTSHILADGIAHPFVRDKVGDYAAHKARHRELEMQLDVLFYQHLMARAGEPDADLISSGLYQELMNVTPAFYPMTPEVMALFSQLIGEIYAMDCPPEMILGWADGLHRMLELAEGKVLRLFREWGPIHDLTFPTFSEIKSSAEEILTLRQPLDRAVNFRGNIAPVHFLGDVVPEFYQRFIPVLEQAYQALFQAGEPLSLADLPPIDLDTGRLLAANNNLDHIPAFWS